MTTKSTDPRPTAVPDTRDRGGSEERIHLSAIVLGLIDARATHVDFLDTPGGDELVRWYRRHHPGRRQVHH